MKKEIIATAQAPSAIGPYSQALKIEAGGMLYCSGQIALDPQSMELVGEDAGAQTHQIMKNLTAVLNQAGLTLENVVKATVYLKDMADFAQVNEAYAEYFTAIRPARAAVEVAALPKNALVEIEALACY